MIVRTEMYRVLKPEAVECVLQRYNKALNESLGEPSDHLFRVTAQSVPVPGCPEVLLLVEARSAHLDVPQLAEQIRVANQIYDSSLGDVDWDDIRVVVRVINPCE